jgi:hypothetical protein
MGISVHGMLITPQVISNFFAGSNVIDMHNQLHQDLLKLEKKWVTQNPWFRLAATLAGINVYIFAMQLPPGAKLF